MNPPDASHNADSLIALIRTMAHDIRAPLGTVISTADMLAEGIYDPLTAKQTRASDRLRRNSRRVLAILDDFVTYLKVSTGQLELVPNRFDPRISLATWCNQVQPACAEKGLVLQVTTSALVPPYLVGDAGMLGRTLIPLLWNAVAFSPQGVVAVLSDWSESQHWLISVRDSGPGIPADALPHIFEPFWRGEDRPSVPTAGAGLGLPLAQALAARIQGKLCLERTSPQGSTFCLELPLAVAKD